MITKDQSGIKNHFGADFYINNNYIYFLFFIFLPKTQIVLCINRKMNNIAFIFSM